MRTSQNEDLEEFGTVEEIENWEETPRDYFRCYRCKETKHFSEFYPCLSRCHGISSRCKMCEREYQRDRYRNRKKRNV